jgi:radical SAM protein with 4Fe4S-binding SPASM domain
MVFPQIIGRLDRYHEGPPSIQIEPTNFCNADCICCSVSRSTRPRGNMNLELFHNIIDDASQIGVRRIILFLHGESLLHPNIIDMIRYIKQQNLAFNITTNGMPLNKKKIDDLLDSGLDSGDYISFSILGSSKDVHEGIMRGGNYNRVEKNARYLLNQRKKRKLNGPIVETHFYEMEENTHEKDEYIKKWRGIVDHAVISGKISEAFQKYKQREAPLPPRVRTCSHLWQKMTVFWNGDVTICNQDVDGDWILGNLKENSIKELWTSDKLLSIKKAHKKKDFSNLPLCYDCDM